MLTTIAVILYLVAATLAFWAALAAIEKAGGKADRKTGCVRAPAWHGRMWLIIAALFVALAISRQFGIEEALRIWLRGGLQADGVYQQRREYQAILASLIIVITSLGAMGGFALMVKGGMLRRSGPSRIVVFAILAACTMVMLVILRLVSLHMLDVLLFRGPRLNWLLDIGSTFVVGGASVRYVQVLARKIRR
ncbi:hypothetical protein [Novosphingobium sp.]|uniref:hypothetical protein n=1 Tax=Novosphingobium sp. TaxID=1874826 RepID=UPI00261B2726|nr:hypothetical protein [Novosphingobium sp.]